MFVSPVEAFQIVGHESFGSSWSVHCINDEDSEHRSVALANLCLALQSGQVDAFWNRFDYERPLKPIEAAGEFFKIDLERDCINLSFFASEPIQAGIHADDLKAFVRNNLDASLAPTVGDETACRKWIVMRIRNEERVTPTRFLWTEAKRKFPRLSRRAFSRARRAAIIETGRVDISKGGRPRNEPAAQIT